MAPAGDSGMEMQVEDALAPRCLCRGGVNRESKLRSDQASSLGIKSNMDKYRNAMYRQKQRHTSKQSVCNNPDQNVIRSICRMRRTAPLGLLLGQRRV